MDYQQTVDYLFSRLPMYQHVGAPAYKPGLDNIKILCTHLGNPHEKYPTLHVAGTNGKGSSSHLLASVLQEAGYNVGLYTSPHLKNFTERIRVNGIELEQDFVIDFVHRIKPYIETIEPSFFEITVAMAFEYFFEKSVDVAVIEVGMGGRLDSTNIITPVISLITNISYDHQAFLGDTLSKIAYEKAGIIKYNVPVVISEYQEETEQVFKDKSQREEAPIYFAQDDFRVEFANAQQDAVTIYQADEPYLSDVSISLRGAYQLKNIGGVCQVITLLQAEGWAIDKNQIRDGISNVLTNTNLKGRWQIIQVLPIIIADTAHNLGGIAEVMRQAQYIPHDTLRIIFATTKERNPDEIFPLLPRNAVYYFTQFESPRGLDVDSLVSIAATYNLQGNKYQNVNEALAAVRAEASEADFILITGSNFLIAEIDEL